MNNRVCGVCGKELDGGRADQRFCSRYCRVRYFRRQESTMTPEDMHDLSQASKHLLEALRHLDRVALTPRGGFLIPMRDRLNSLWRAVARRHLIEMRQGGYDPRVPLSESEE